MSASRALRDEARRQREKLLLDIDARLATKEEVSLDGLDKRLQALAELSAVRSRGEATAAVLLPVVVALVVLLLAWRIPTPAPVVEVTVDATRVELALGAPGAIDLGSFPPMTRARVEGLDGARSDVGGIDFAGAKGGGTVSIEGRVHVSSIELRPLAKPSPPAADAPGDRNGKAGAAHRIAIARSGASAQIGTEGFAVRANVTLAPPARLVSAVGATVRQAAVSEASVELAGSAVWPAAVRVFVAGGDGRVDLPPLDANRLSFETHAFDASEKRESSSSILKGKLRLTATGREYELPWGTDLVLRELDGPTRVSIEPGGVRISFHGTAGVLGLGGRNGAVVDLRPNLAEWAARDRTVALVWSSFIFLLGLVLTVCRSLLERAR